MVSFSYKYPWGEEKLAQCYRRPYKLTNNLVRVELQRQGES